MTTEDYRVVDSYGNVMSIVGELDQEVTVGARFGQPGTTERTGLTGRGIAIRDGARWVVTAENK